MDFVNRNFSIVGSIGMILFERIEWAHPNWITSYSESSISSTFRQGDLQGGAETVDRSENLL